MYPGDFSNLPQVDDGDVITADHENQQADAVNALQAVLTLNPAKAPVRVATTEALDADFAGGTFTSTIEEALAIDGVSLAVDDRVLVKNESGVDDPHNGIYAVTDAGSGSTPWVLARTADMSLSSQVPGAMVYVNEGTSNAGRLFGVTGVASDSFTIDTSAIAWSDVLAANVQPSLAEKLDRAGGTMTGDIAMGSHAVTGLADPISDQDAATKAYVDSHAPSLDPDLEAIADLTGTGILTRTAADTWALLSDPLPLDHGGTGASTATGARSSLGAAASGANSDVTSLSGLTTPLSAAQGGTGSSTGYSNPGAGTDSEHFGASSTATGTRATSLGNDAVATAADATSIGGYSQALSTSSSAFGAGSEADAQYDTALGAYAMASGAANTETGKGAVAVGYGAIAYGDGSIAIGQDASTETYGAERSIALGKGASATAANQFVIGSTSYPITSMSFAGSGCRISNVTDPSSAQDAATKAYVDSHSASAASSFVMIANEAGLSNERALAGSSTVQVTDNGANSTVALSVKKALDSTYLTDFNSAVDARVTAGVTVTTEGALINGATSKTTPVDADQVGLMDSAASNVLKKLSWANIKATLKTYFDTIYTLTALGGVPTSRTVNGHALSADVSVTKGDLSLDTTDTPRFAALGIGRAASTSGVAFPASASASSDANTLDDYEEGTWTPVDATAAGLTLTVTSATYTKVGDTVRVSAYVIYPVTASGLQAFMSGLPFASAHYACASLATNCTQATAMQLSAGATTVVPFGPGGAACTNANLSNKFLIFEATYKV